MFIGSHVQVLVPFLTNSPSLGPAMGPPNAMSLNSPRKIEQDLAPNTSALFLCSLSLSSSLHGVAR